MVDNIQRVRHFFSSIFRRVQDGPLQKKTDKCDKVDGYECSDCAMVKRIPHTHTAQQPSNINTPTIRMLISHMKKRIKRTFKELATATPLSKGPRSIQAEKYLDLLCPRDYMPSIHPKFYRQGVSKLIWKNKTCDSPHNFTTKSQYGCLDQSSYILLFCFI